MANKFDLFLTLAHLDVATREIVAQEGVHLLELLRSILHHAPGSISCTSWFEQAAKAYDQMHRKRPTIAIVGSTGAGKTSFINAVIDEETLLPTNCMRACTATITEISFNHGLRKYRAEIEFLSKADWSDELTKGFQVLFGTTGKIVNDATNDDSEAGIFYSKIRAIYSQMTRGEIEQSTVESLMKHPSVDVLGESESFESDDATVFSNRLQAIIDSKDRFGKGFGGDVAYWPIIRRVKLLVKAPALETGVTLVDLPGVQDSTPARAQIAENYKKTCSGLIVTAPIQRAADDRIAKNLLGPTFRRQVMMDGGYSTMTFVCTKADEININEVAKSPPLKVEIDRIEADFDDCRKKRAEIQTRLDAAITQLQHAEHTLLTASAKFDMMEDIFRNACATLKALHPTTSVHINSFGKRQLPDETENANAKRHEGGDGRTEQKVTKVPITETMSQAQSPDLIHAQRDVDTAKGKSQSLKAILDLAKEEKSHALEEVQQLRTTVAELDTSLTLFEDEKRAACIRYRNHYVVDALKHDFVAGVKERDQERLAEESPCDWDPAMQTRDYDRLGAELPVLTVSARAYQQKMGRLKEEVVIRGFINTDDTGIPAAVKHCQQLTNAARIKNADFFLAMFSKLLNSLDLWWNNEKNGNTLSDAQREQIKQHLQQRLIALESSFFKIVKESTDEIRRGIKSMINSHLETARALAVSKSGPTAEAWSGLANPTWKAICRRRGIYTNENGSYDWNEDLVAPMLEHIAPQWEQAFSATIIKPFDRFCVSIRHKIKEFHRSMEMILEPHALNLLQPFTALQMHNREYKTILKAVTSDVTEIIQSQQKEINRAFKPTIANAMRAAYAHCMSESGPGSQKRMTEHMKDHVEKERSMFRDATKNVQARLDEMVSDARKYLKMEVSKIHEDIQTNYISTLCGNDFEDESRSDERQLFAAEIGQFLDSCEREFGDFARRGGWRPRDEGRNNVPRREKTPEPINDTFSDCLFHSDAAGPLDSKSAQASSLFALDTWDTTDEVARTAQYPAVKTEAEDGQSGEYIRPEQGVGYRRVGNHYWVED